jgi:glycosyltransferase involved in cell wall biosynthesis
LVSPFHSTGGAESYSLNLSKALSQSENSVTLFVNSGKTKAGTSVYLGKLKINYLKSEVLPFDPSNPISLSLIKALTNENFDIIHIHQMYTFFNLFSSLSGWTKRIPTVLTDHGGGWRLAAIPHICANLPNAFAAVSEFSLQRMLYFAPKKRDRSRVVYGGVNTDVFHFSPKSVKLRERLALTDEYVVLYLGRVLPNKGVDVAIKALRLMPRNTRLLVVGPILDFEYFSYLKRLVSKDIERKVTFLGEVNNQDLPDYYNICDVFVQPSLYFDYHGRYHRVSELLGLAKFEAMACGKSVVVSKVGGLPEKIIKGENGYTFEPGNEKELARYVTDLLMDETLRKKVGAKALSTVQRELTWNKIASNVLEFYYFLMPR